MKSKFVIGGTVAGVALAGLLYASPYITLRSIAKAVDRQDADAVSEHVDFPALRENVKGQLMAKLQSDMDKPEMKENPFAGLGSMLAMGMVGNLTDTMISPAGVMMMLKNGKPGKTPSAASAGNESAASKKNITVDYQGWSKVFVHPKGEPVGFIFKRDGLMGWKLVAVKLD